MSDGHLVFAVVMAALCLVAGLLIGSSTTPGKAEVHCVSTAHTAVVTQVHDTSHKGHDIYYCITKDRSK